MPDIGAFKDMTALGIAALCVAALALTIRVVLQSRVNGYFKPDKDYPVTRAELEDAIDERVFHRRNGDLMHFRIVLDALRKGDSDGAERAFERMCNINTQRRP